MARGTRAVPLVTVDLLFLAANLTKIAYGAWLPLLIGIVAFTVLTTWRKGQGIVTARREAEEGSLRAFVDEINKRERPIDRVPGTAVFLHRTKATTPLAMRASVKHLHALNEHVVILSLHTQPIPRVRVADRVTIDNLGYRDDGIAHVAARLGYMDHIDIPALLAQVDRARLEMPIDLPNASYFLSTVDLYRGDDPTMSRWRKQLFIATAQIAADAAEYFRLPRDRTVIVGARIEV